MNELYFPAAALQKKRFGAVFLLCIFACLSVLAVFTGNRDSSIGTDTAVYRAIYAQIGTCSCLVDGVEPVFSLLALVISFFDLSADIFMSIVSLLQFTLLVLLSLALRNLVFDAGHGKSFQVLFVAISIASPFFFNGQTNLLRQGISAPLVLLAATYAIKRQWFAAGALSVMAVGIHYSSVLFLVSFLLLRTSLPKIYLIVTLGSTAYLSGATEEFVKLVSNFLNVPAYTFFQEYGIESDYGRGIRLDFWIFSLLPLICIHVANFLAPSYSARERALPLEKIYLLLLVPFLMFGWGGFSDRYLFNAWLFAPALLALPVARVIRDKAFFVIAGVAIIACATYVYYIFFSGSISF